ncbi:hypothetical protein [Dysgonomonas sp. 25]|uniref:hypothetical protein n=1 Tax=Dysgonomonas sp. 25 TaxID=2302933 RepID=UPI0013D3FE99|nr:hypothetical protein [Dysgonomonas sp. 25]NDV68927.1 hypothetical protein [Dysgonomonas sp. 25]
MNTLNKNKKSIEYILETYIRIYDESQNIGKVEKWWNNSIFIGFLSVIFLLALTPILIIKQEPPSFTFIFIFTIICILWLLIIVLIIISISDRALKIRYKKLKIKGKEKKERSQNFNHKKRIYFYNQLKKNIIINDLDQHIEIIKDEINYHYKKIKQTISFSLIFAFVLSISFEIRNIYPNEGWRVYIAFYLIVIIVAITFLFLINTFHNLYIVHTNKRNEKLISILKYLREIKLNQG